MTHSKKKIIKEIHIHPDKCNGCRACEIACAAFHSNPKYNGFNPARSRIRMIINEINDEWVAVRSGSLNKTECKARSRYVIDGKEYSECSFCSAICSSRDMFRQPDSDLPLKCDMCGEDPDQIPLCVQICSRDALTYSTREDTVQDEVNRVEMEKGLATLSGKHGLEKLKEAAVQMMKKKQMDL